MTDDRCPYCGTELKEVDGSLFCPNCGMIKQGVGNSSDEIPTYCS